MKEPVWVPLEAVIAIQAELIAEHGGLHGAARDNDLRAALARPRNLLAHAEPPPSLARFAAAYGFALARSRGFPDGNKRVALAMIDVFLMLNGFELNAPEPDAAGTVLALAAGELTEEALADWIAASSAKL
jgi:death-on-curing protein